MRTPSRVDRKPDEPVFEVDVTLPGLKAAGGASDRLRFSAETRSAAERDEIVKQVKRLASIPRWDVLMARVDGRFTTRELMRAAGPGGESLDELLTRTAPAPAAVVTVLPLLASHVDPYLQQPTRSNLPRDEGGVKKLKMQLDRFISFCGGPDAALASHLNDEKISEFLGKLTNARTGRPADGQTVNRYRAALSGFARYCLKKGLIDRHPVRDGIVLKLPEKGGERIPDWFGPEDYDLYFAAIAARSERMVIFFRLLISTGVDLEELLELRVRDITFGDEVSLISTRRLKRDTGVRIIPFPATHNDALRDHIAQHKLKARHKVFGMLKVTRTASGVSCYEVNSAHRAGRLALGRTTAHEALRHKIEREDDQAFRIKDLRHLAAIAWVRGGVPLEQVQYYLGHTSLVQTQIYARYRPKADDYAAAVRAMSQAFE
jgi:integrase